MNLPMKFSMMAIGLLVCGLAILFSCKVTVSGQSSSNSSVPPLCAAFESEAPAQTPTVIPEPDVALEHWKSKSKFFLVIAATKTAVPNANLEFAKVNAEFVSNRLSDRGYTQLAAPLTDENATRDNVIDALHRINNVPDNGLVVVYYSGHGVKNDNDEELWLQLFGQHLGSGFGISARDLISEARGSSYEGDLVVIIDSCFSGQGTLSSLTGKKLDKTIIITSSSQIQNSLVTTIPDGSTASAFTFFFTEALTKNWQLADSDGDGILQYSELVSHLTLRLSCLFIEKKLKQELDPSAKMDPKSFYNSREKFFAYDQTTAKNLNSTLRQELTLEELLRELKSNGTDQISAIANSAPAEIIVNESTSAINSTAMSSSQAANPQQADQNEPVSKRALALAELITDASDPYARALKLIALGRPKEAIALLQNPDQNANGDVERLYLALGLAQRYAGKYSEAVKTYKKGLTLGKDKENLLDEAAHASYLEAKYKDAERFLKKSLEIKSKNLGAEHPEVANTLDNYAELLRKTNRMEKAQSIERQAASIRVKVQAVAP